MKQNKNLTIKSLIHKEYKATFLFTIIFIETMLLLLYFGVNYYTSLNTKNVLTSEAKENLSQISYRESKNINFQLKNISDMARFVQKEQQEFFENKSIIDLKNNKPIFKKAPNGVFYKVNNNGGSCLVFLNIKKVKIGKAQIEKAKKTEAFDSVFKHLYEANPNIVAIYFNTHDSLNRYYPFVDNFYSQYDPYMDIPKFNFYYEADLKHNPSKKPVWTDVYLDPAGKGWMASCIVPIYNKNFLEGVTGIDITINTFIKNIISLNLPWKASAFLIDKHGTILAMQEETEKILGIKELKKHNYEDSIKVNTFKPAKYNIFKSKNKVIAETLKNIYKNNASLSEIKINGVDYILSQNVIPETGWRFLVLVNKDNIFRPIHELQHKTQKLGIISIIYVIFLYILLYFYISRKTKRISSKLAEPILSLSDNTDKILSGKKIDISPCGIEEIDKMSRNFNVMTNRLRILYENLKHDINNRKHIQSELQKSKEIAEIANQAKSDFWANMCHELRTPLTSIQGSIKLLMSNALKDDPVEINNFLKVANYNCSSLITLVNNLIDITKIEQNKLEFDLMHLELLPLLQDAVDTNIAYAKQFNVNLELNFEISNTDLKVNVDRYRLIQILSNLTSNAIKHSPLNDKVVISACKNGNNVKISIIDNGPGIPKEQQENLFQRFHQTNSSNSRKKDGTGLGLYISKLLVEKMNGNIGYIIDENTIFYINLPILK